MKLVCDKCSKAIPDGARFCPQCGDPVTDADRPAAPSDFERERVRLNCPKCQAQEIYEMRLVGGRPSLLCPKCGAAFESQITIIRAKRSKKNVGRTFSIRVRNFDGEEQLIEFNNLDETEFELRSRDIAAFTYLNGELRVVQNLTVHQSMTISKPSCFIATCVYGSGSNAVETLSLWRDRYLLPSPVGSLLVNIYYAISPVLARILGRSIIARYLIRAVLAPLVWLARRGGR